MMAEQTEQTLDFSATYEVTGGPAVAWQILGYVRTPIVDAETGEELRVWMGELDDAYHIDRMQVSACMIGDNRIHVIDVDDLVELDELAYCGECGQIGCGHDGRDRG